MPQGRVSSLKRLSTQIRQCRICIDDPIGAPLPHEPRPVFQVSREAKICICGQAPGTRVHASGRPFTDPSGDRLRDWMGIGEEIFYDARKVAIVPMGFCFPGLDAKGGDLPPRRECNAQWHSDLFAHLPQLKLVLLVGQYAQKWHLGKRREKTLTQTVRRWRDYYSPEASADAHNSAQLAYLPLPHPSWRNNHWIKKNQWFEYELLPELRQAVQQQIT